MVSITIDGKQIQVPEGTTVLRAAESADIKIPTLCDHPQLTPYGGCRLCLVEVEGARTLQPSCTLPVMPNMVVHTDTEKVTDARKFVLTLIFSERNHFCMYCQVSGGDCELQNAAYAEGMTHWPLQTNYSPFTVDASNPYFVIDNNRCILCRRCVRACAELVGNFTLGIEDRGANSVLVADLGNPIGESTCISCGTCVQVCPTGAIIDRQSAYNGREQDLTHIKSICTACSIGCGLNVLTRDNRVVRIDGDWDAQVNHGLLCAKGRFEPLVNDKERIATAMVRKGARMKAATTKEALNAAVNLIKAAEKDGAMVGAFITASASAEELHQFIQLFENVKNARYGTIGSIGYLQSMKTLALLAKIERESDLIRVTDSDCVLVIGADLILDHQVAGFMVKRNLPAGTKLILASNDDNQLAPFADAILDTKMGLVGALEDLVVVMAEKKTDLTSNAAKAAAYLKEAQSVGVIIGEIAVGSSTAKVLEAVTSLLDKLSSDGKTVKYITLKGQSNAYAAYLLGLDKPVDFHDLETVFVFQSEEILDQTFIQELETVPNLVVQSCYTNSLTAKAQVVFPSTIWAENQGSYINLEGKVQHSNQIIRPTESIPTLVETMQGLAKSLGSKVDSNWSDGLDRHKIVTVPKL
ncbi:MAG: hypothetical protein C0391_05820 [Anaerolinea sp.]|nr:hypothetical protein [Anaerolinea sp.]